MQLISDNNINEIKIYDALKQVLDPELGINIIDMGLIYRISFRQDGIEVDMTLSSKSCPLGNHLRKEVENVLQALFPGISYKVSLVWEPAWSSAFISPRGLEQLHR